MQAWHELLRQLVSRGAQRTWITALRQKHIMAVALDAPDPGAAITGRHPGNMRWFLASTAAIGLETTHPAPGQPYVRTTTMTLAISLTDGGGRTVVPSQEFTCTSTVDSGTGPLDASSDGALACGVQMAEAIAARLPPEAQRATDPAPFHPRPGRPDMRNAVRFEETGYLRTSGLRLPGTRADSADQDKHSWTSVFELAGGTYVEQSISTDETQLVARITMPATHDVHSYRTRTIHTPQGDYIIDDARHRYSLLRSDGDDQPIRQQMDALSRAIDRESSASADSLERVGMEGATVHYRYKPAARARRGDFVIETAQVDDVDVEYGAPLTAWKTLLGALGERQPLGAIVSGPRLLGLFNALRKEIRASNGPPHLITGHSSRTDAGECELRIEFRQGTPQTTDFAIPGDYAYQDMDGLDMLGVALLL
jgi:hypothetical protein